MSMWLPRLYDTLMEPLERWGFRAIRKALIRKATGVVLEIGSGTGFNFPYYDLTQVSKVLAIEPEPLMRKKSLLRAAQSAVPIEVILASAEKLPFPDNSFDTVVGTLVLCTIPNLNKALAEIRRVCKPTGQILFFEHVRVNHSFLGHIQDWLTPIWKHLCGGCHLNRNTPQIIKDAGFEIAGVKQYYKSIFLTFELQNKKNLLI